MGDTERRKRVLVTGATGYLGGRLVPRLLQEGYSVRCLVRAPTKLQSTHWFDDVEILTGSVEGPLDAAMAGVDVAVYLVHGIGDGRDWAAKESRDAAHFRVAAQRADVGRIVYLGGMGVDDAPLSEHLMSRHDVGRALAAGNVPVSELRAAVIIGSGSASFEMLRYLVEVLPVMVTPKWVATKTQLIAISDVLEYLVAVISSPDVLPGVFEIGGPDVVSYAGMMDIYAQEAGLSKRRLIRVPFLTPRLSSHWVGLVTPVPASLARPLVESLINEVIVRDSRTIGLLGAPQRPLRDAIRLALGRTNRGEIPTSFTDADLQPFRAYSTDPAWAGGTELCDERYRDTKSGAHNVFVAVTSVGGDKGWHSGEWLWRVRGLFDQLWGGPGLRRGRRHQSDLHVGDFVDFWRVDEIVEDQLVRLHAEMRLPGEAWLEWRITTGPRGTRLTQRATFKPRGLLGRLYWFSVAPFHLLVFPGLLRGIVADAEGV